MLTERMNGLARELGLRVEDRRTGRVYLPKTLEPVQNASSGIGIYSTRRGMEMNLSVFRAYGEDAVATSLLAALAAVTGIPFKGAHYWPSVTDPGRLVTSLG